MAARRTHYEPVDSANGQIRLLILYPQTKNSKAIYCELKPVYLSSKPEYEALSYTWGTPGQTSEVRLGNQQFQVGENLGAALQRLRHSKKERRLWIDAICINQDDLSERSAQVLLMRQVYSQASQVRVWLGEFGEGGLAAMHTLQINIFGYIKSTWQLDKKYGHLSTLSKTNWLMSSATKIDTSNFNDEFLSGEVRELLTRPWWRRTWVIQEAVLANKLVLMCGSETTSWESVPRLRKVLPLITDHFQAFGIFLYEKNIYLDGPHLTISNYRKRFRSSPSSMNILDVLYHFRNLECHDPRDRIFGFLGIAPSALEMGIMPDYESSTSQVYCEFARKVMLATGSLDVLNYKREWRGVNVTPQPEKAFSVLDQLRYYDPDARVIDGPGKKPRPAWARLPEGWERIPEGKKSTFLDHKTGKIYDTSPLKGQPPVPSEYFTMARTISPGWSKRWNNLGCPQVRYQPQDTTDDDNKASQKVELDKLPSWAPNWAFPTPWDPAPLIDWPHPYTQQYFASGSTRCNLEPLTPSTSDSNNTLTFRGLLFDTIADLAPPWHPETDIPPITRTGIEPLYAWETLATSPVPHDPYQALDPPLTRQQALNRTLLAEHPPSPSPSPSPYRPLTTETLLLLELFHNNPNWLPSLPDPTTSAATHSLFSSLFIQDKIKDKVEKALYDRFIELSLTETYYPYLETEAERTAYVDRERVSAAYGEVVRWVYRVCAHRRLFVTKGGYLGLAGWDAKVGDVVGVFEGGQTPFLVREGKGRGEGEMEGVYQLVGETYVCGIMGGEAWEMGLERGVFEVV